MYELCGAECTHRGPGVAYARLLAGIGCTFGGADF